MVATTGARLLQSEAIKVLIEELLPVTFLLTPNLAEAKLLLETAGICSKEPRTYQDLVETAKSVRSLGPKYVLLKGGHLPLTESLKVADNESEGRFVMNILQGAEETTLIKTEFLTCKNTHGTGCSLACRK